MTKTKDQILEEMREAMPFHLPERIRPYIEEAMEIYANQQLQQYNVSGRSEQLVNFLLHLNGKELINNYEFDYEKEAKKYLKKITNCN